MREEFIWAEKYRPKTIDDIILPKKLKGVFKSIVEKGEVPNMLFTGTPGLGKTTVAKAICIALDVDYIIINGSDERNIDTLRTKVRQFASSVSLHGGQKVVILDEADYLNPQSFQPALRGFIEEFSSNCRFILTCNFKNKIIEPLHSRLGVYEFNMSKKELAALAGEFMKNAENILTTEGIEFDKKVLANVILKHAPDWRRILVELQRASMSGEITEATVVASATKFDDLIGALKEKNFKKVRSWTTNNIDSDPASIFRGIYDASFAAVKPASIPSLILILAEYQYKAAFVADHELNVVACMIEIMQGVEFL